MKILFIITLINSIASSLQALPVTVNEFKNDKSPTKVLIFLSEKCPCSCSHVDHLNKLAQKFGRQVAFYGVISEPIDKSEREKTLTYFSSSNFSFPIVEDPEQVLVNKYKALKTPHTTILKKEKAEYKVIYQGGVSDKSQFSLSTKKYLQANLKSLQSNEALKYSVGRSLGCYIKRH